MNFIPLPWKAATMLEYPWLFPAFLFILSLLLSIITWVRSGK
ncbi:MAG: hypothetical protein ACQEWV_30960 [Bacillota bacterium]